MPLWIAGGVGRKADLCDTVGARYAAVFVCCRSMSYCLFRAAFPRCPRIARMFKVLGVPLVLYVCYSVVAGRVLAKAGVRMREVHRDASPRYFWVVIAIYAGLSIALVTIF
jgi:hypothetical protein